MATVQAPSSERPPRKKKRRNPVGRFTEGTQQWFEQGEKLAEDSADDLPAELVGYYDEPWYARLTRPRVALALASLAGVLVIAGWAVAR
ncbi:MAG TPA: hypothetical protein VML75_07565 [Kofleriaceae bacterium]|nr:hypothetical protein [Kofleriaceae bacterium]